MSHILKMIDKRRSDLADKIAKLRYPVGPPDFVGVGSMRCGTSWWYSLIAKHPMVFNNKKVFKNICKEHHFFDLRRDRPITEELKREYYKGFPKVGWKSGEWTPCYMRHQRVPEMLHACAPNVKILVLLRDPIERYQSHVRYDMQRWPYNLKHPNFYKEVIERGRYFSHLKNVMKFFPKDRILVLQYEKCVLNPVDEIKKTYRFLGLNDSFIPSQIDRLVNKSFAQFHIEDFVDSLKAYYQEEVLGLANEFNIDLRLWPNFR